MPKDRSTMKHVRSTGRNTRVGNYQTKAGTPEDLGVHDPVVDDAVAVNRGSFARMPPKGSNTPEQANGG